MIKIFRERINDGRKTIPLHYLCGYIPNGAGGDDLSESILAFKGGSEYRELMWLDFVTEAFASLGLHPDDILVRALSHGETRITGGQESQSPLGKLCEGLAHAFGCRYLPSMVFKHRETKSLKRLDMHGRWKELRNVYGIEDGYGDTPFRKVWLLDDVVTTGATAKAIWKTFRDVWHDVDFNVFALARTTRIPGYNEDLEMESQHFTWKDGILVLREPEGGYGIPKLTADDLVSPVFDNSGTFITPWE